MDSTYLPFSTRLDKAIHDSEFSEVVPFLLSSPSSCRTDPASVARLLNNLARLNMIESINDCFQALIRIGFVFDSIEYVEPLRLLSLHGKWATQARVLEELIVNKVSIEPIMIQKALDSFFVG